MNHKPIPDDTSHPYLGSDNPYITVDSTWIEPQGPEEITPEPDSYEDTEDCFMDRAWNLIQELDKKFKEWNRYKNLDLPWEKRDPMRFYGEQIKPLFMNLASHMISLEQKKALWDKEQERINSK